MKRLRDRYSVNDIADPDHRAYPFDGGFELTHPQAAARVLPIQPLPLPERLFLPLQRHSAPLQLHYPLSSEVKKGQYLGCYPAWHHFPLHAPATGTLSGICSLNIPAESCTEYLVLECDHTDAAEVPPAPDQSGSRNLPDVWLARIQQAGLMDIFDTDQPVATRLSTVSGKHPLLIIHASDTTPWITTRRALVRQNAERCAGGIAMLVQLLQPVRCVVILPEAYSPEQVFLSQALERTVPDCLPVPLKTRYPGHHPLLVFRQLFGRWPAESEAVLHLGIETAFTIRQTIHTGRPQLSQTVSIADHNRVYGNFTVPFGTLVRDILSSCPDIIPPRQPCYSNTPFQGLTLPSASLLSITDQCLFLTQQQPASKPVTASCNGCHACLPACPAQLDVPGLYALLQTQHIALAANALQRCITCGCCDIACPEQLPLSRTFHDGKQHLRTLYAQQAQAHVFRQRFEQRNQRRLRDKEEKNRMMAETQRNAAHIPQDKTPPSSPVAQTQPMEAAPAIDKQALVAAAIERARNRQKQLNHDTAPVPPESGSRK